MKLLRSAVLSAALMTAAVASAQTSEGNSVTLLSCGSDFYSELAGAIDGAQKSICFQYYSVGCDSVSTALLGKLQKKAAEGVEVYAIIDNYGCRHRENPMDDSLIEKYRDNGLDIALFNVRRIANPLPRNHRKLTVIDGCTAFVGGMNIHDSNIHPSEVLGEVRDYTLRLDGPVAGILQQTFEQSWNEWSDHQAISVPEPSEMDGNGDLAVKVCPTKGFISRPTVRDHYLRLIESAGSSIVIANAYFIPSPPIRKALRKAADRGVDVSISTGGITDLDNILKQRQLRNLNRMQKCPNVTVRTKEGSFIHAKAISIDSHILFLGSANLDYLSRTINYELCVEIDDDALATQFEATLR